MSTKVYMGGGGVQKVQKLVYVVYGWHYMEYYLLIYLINIDYFLYFYLKQYYLYIYTHAYQKMSLFEPVTCKTVKVTQRFTFFGASCISM